MELYEYPRTKWVGEFIGDFPMNFIPGDWLGAQGVEIGFRPEWVKLDGNDFRGTVSSMESVGEYTYLFLDVKDTKVIVKGSGQFDVGDEVSFSINKCRRFKDGFIVDQK